MFVVLLSLAACRQSDPVDGLPSLPFEQSGSTTIQLSRTPGRFIVAPSNLPAGARTAATFDIGDAEWELVPHTARMWRAKAPFPTGKTGVHYPPTGIRVFVGDTEMVWDGDFKRGPKPAWRLSRGYLQVATESEDPPGGIVISHERIGDALDRLDFEISGLQAEEYVHFARLATPTRAGLLLPAPSTGEWDLDLPPGARFRASLSIVGTGVGTVRSDGAYAALTVVDGGTVTEVASKWISANGADADWDVDLDPWSGRHVVLRVETRPYDTVDGDYVFLGSPVVEGQPAALPRRVVIIAVDTLRPDHLGSFGYPRDTSPELDAMTAQSTVFESAWAPAPRTRPSFRTATTGRWPLAAVGATSIGATFADHGFATAGIVANLHLNPRFDFHSGYDLWWLDPQAKANEQVDRSLAWLEDHRRRDTFLFMHIMDPHLHYNAPGRFRNLFVTNPDPALPAQFNRWEVYDWARRHKLTEQRKQHIIGLHDGEIAWTDMQLGRFLRGLEALPGRTLVVFHTDHGEEFWDHDGFEHNHTLYDEVVRTALWFRTPGQVEGHRPPVDASLADIAPTLYDYAGIPDPPPVDGMDLRPWLDDPDTPPPPSRPIPIGYLRYDTERWGVVYDHHKYILFTGQNREELYNLAADPKEQTNLAGTVDLEPWRKALGEAHHISVGPGWRVTVRMMGSKPVVLTLAEPCLEAGVIDPESLTDHPVNQEWGEVPAKLPADVGTVTLSDDRLTITYTPGPQPSGMLYVRFDHPVDPAVALSGTCDGEPLERVKVHGFALQTRDGGQFRPEEGTVVVPPPDEAARMAEVAAAHGDAASQDSQLLQSLGYIGGN